MLWVVIRTAPRAAAAAAESGAARSAASAIASAAGVATRVATTATARIISANNAHEAKREAQNKLEDHYEHSDHETKPGSSPYHYTVMPYDRNDEHHQQLMDSQGISGEVTHQHQAAWQKWAGDYYNNQ